MFQGLEYNLNINLELFSHFTTVLEYSKTFVKRSTENRQNKDLNYK